MLRLLATSLFLLAAEGSAPPAGGAFGQWLVNGARIELSDDGGKIVGRLAAEGGPCPVAVGTELLRGTLLDDSLSAQVRLCLVAPQCASDEGTALAVLLVTKTLSGGVHTRAACAQDVHAFVLRRPGAAGVAMAAPAPNERLSKTAPPPRAPRSEKKVATNDIAVNTKLSVPALVREATPAATPQAQAQKLLEQGASELQAGRIERARAAFRRALEKDPQRAEAFNGVGVTFYARGDLDEALAWYKRGLVADPGFGDVYYNMACVYALQGHKDLAFRYLRMAALNHWSGREQMQKDPDLTTLHGDPQWAEILDELSAEAKPSHP